jgi:hypothetical protein
VKADSSSEPTLSPPCHLRPLLHALRPPNTCTFSFLASTDSGTASIWAYDHACVEIGHNPSVPSPNHNLKKPFAFDSQLKSVIYVYFTKWYLPPSVGYRGKQHGWESTGKVNCSHAGQATDQPWYRLAGHFPFIC